MSIAMPAPDAGTLAKRDEIVAAMRAIVPGEGRSSTPMRCGRGNRTG